MKKEFQSKYEKILVEYCTDISSGKIPACQQTKKAIQRFQNDLKRQKEEAFNYIYNQSAADILCNFAESLKPSDLNGETLTLLNWQVFCLCQLEGWRYKAEPDRKRFRTGYIEVNRKNGKTTGLLMPMVLFNFLKYSASESYLISSRDDLAEKTFKEIVATIESDKKLSEICNCKSLAITCDNSRLGFFCDGGKNPDGFRPRFFCIDEYHEYQTDNMFTSMSLGMRSKKDAQGVMITTADADINRPCYEQSMKSRRILNGLQVQDDFFCIIYTLDENDDIHDKNVWIKANPSLGSIIPPDVISADIQDAELTPARMPDLKAKTFGIWGGGGQKSWIPLEIFQKNKDIETDFEKLKDIPCTGGLDLSSVSDFSAYTLMWNYEGKIYTKHKFYIPQGQFSKKYLHENVSIYTWAEQGYITTTAGETVDYEFIINDILEDCKKFKIAGLGYDKWQARDVINALEEENPNLLLIEVEQSLKKLSPMTQSYEKSIRDGKLVDNNPVMAWMINNAEIHPDVNGNYKPIKSSKASTQRIDGVISSIMAHSLLFNENVISTTPPMSYDELMALL